MQPTQFINIVSTVPLVAPKVLKTELAITPATTKTVLDNRESVQRILAGEEHRVLVVVGPCSIHDPKAAVEYAQRLKALSDKVAERMLLVSRRNSSARSGTCGPPQKIMTSGFLAFSRAAICSEIRLFHTYKLKPTRSACRSCSTA